MLSWWLWRLKSSSPSVRARVVGRLADSDRHQAAVALADRARDDHWQVRLAVAKGLERMGTRLIKSFIGSPTDRPPQLSPHVASLGVDAAQVMIQGRAHKARALGTLQKDLRLAALAKLTSDDRGEVRQAATQARDSLFDLQAAALKAVVENRQEHREVRAAATYALGELADVRVLDALLAAYQDIESDVRQAARYGVLKLAGEAVDPLLQRLEQSAPWVRPPTVFLGHDSENPDYEREKYAWGISDLLGAIGPPAGRPLRRALQHPDPAVRRAAEVTLEKIH